MTIDSFTGEYRFLSNFYPCQVFLEGVEYESVEHAYQAAKTVIPEEREMFRAGISAGKAKRLGKTVTLRPDWEACKLQVMENLLIQKFSRDPLKGLLLNTSTDTLIEGNSWGDVFWGVCAGKGENYLGKLLMKIRMILMWGL